MLDTWNKLEEKGVLDAPTVGMYIRGMMENLSPFDPSTATERILPDAEKEELRNIVASKVNKGGKGLSYSDFLTKEEGATALGYKAPIADLTDPRESLRMLLGRADITRDEDGNIYVEDVYDFNAPDDVKNAGIVDKLRMAYGAMTDDKKSTYGKAHTIGELFVEPVPVKIKVGNAADLGIKDISKVPMYRGYQPEEVVDLQRTGFERSIK